MLLFAFALAIMTNPISSVACATEAALRELNGDLRLILPAMGLVVLVIAVIVLNYRQLGSLFPEGGGAPAATGRAFGEPWAFLPIGALIVDFALTIAISTTLPRAAVCPVLQERLQRSSRIFSRTRTGIRPRAVLGNGCSLQRSILPPYSSDEKQEHYTRCESLSWEPGKWASTRP